MNSRLIAGPLGAGGKADEPGLFGGKSVPSILGDAPPRDDGLCQSMSATVALAALSVDGGSAGCSKR